MHIIVISTVDAISLPMHCYTAIAVLASHEHTGLGLNTPVAVLASHEQIGRGLNTPLAVLASHEHTGRGLKASVQTS